VKSSRWLPRRFSAVAFVLNTHTNMDMLSKNALPRVSAVTSAQDPKQPGLRILCNLLKIRILDSTPYESPHCSRNADIV